MQRFLLLNTIWLALHWAAAAQGPTATLRGYVFEGQLPAESATVTLCTTVGQRLSGTYTTDSGAYQFAGLQPGSYILVVQYDAIIDTLRADNLRAGEVRILGRHVLSRAPVFATEVVAVAASPPVVTNDYTIAGSPGTGSHRTARSEGYSGVGGGGTRNRAPAYPHSYPNLPTHNNQAQLGSVRSASPTVRAGRANATQMQLGNTSIGHPGLGPTGGDVEDADPGLGETTDTSGRPRSVPREPSNPFYSSQHRPYASFGADVDQASYTLCRRSVEEWNRLPDPGTVRVEEFLNYFTYSYAAPSRERMLAVYPEMAVCPWNPEHYVVRVAVRAAEVNLREAPAANLVFLVDVSGSMYPQDRLPLVKQALLMLLDTLRPHDRVALVTYAGSSGVVLESTPASHKAKIRQAIEALGAGGSTAGARGILTAYEVAKRHFIAGGNNRVILCTDGDFNVGVSDIAGLKRLIEEKREEGVFLTTLGFGTSGYADQVMETLADNGNGFYAYVSNLAEAQRIFTKGLMGSLLTVAKDVKFQLAFNPEVIRGYRLIGYENRRLTYREFHDDRRDAGDLGAGHYLTVLLELVPAHASAQTLDCTPDTTMLASDQPQWSGANWLTLRMRHKQPAADSSAYWCFNLASAPVPASNPTSDSRWAIGVAWVAQLMRGAGDVPAHTWAQAIAYCQQAQGTDPDGSRAQFVQWAQKAAQLASLNPQAEAGR